MQLYEVVTVAMRVCQLHVVINILLILQGPIIYGLALSVWLATRGIDLVTPFPYPLPDPSMAFGARPWFELIGVAGSIAVFTTFAKARPRKWAPFVSAAALLISLTQMIAWIVGAEVQATVAQLADTDGFALIVGFGLFATSMTALHLYFFILIVRGYRALDNAKPEARAAIADVRGGAGALFRALMMTPEAIRYAKRPRIAAILMSLVGVAGFMNVWRLGYAIIILAFTPAIILMFADPYKDTFLIMRQQGDFAKGFGFFLAITALVGLIYAFIIGIYLLIRLISRSALYRARRYMSRTLSEAQAVDERPPLLFLRSFIDDQVPLTPPRVSVASKLLDGAALVTTLDHVILIEGSHHGPTVALGSPDDTVPPYGAARGYFGHNDWKDAVSQLAADAAHIVIVLDETPGVAWEIETLHRNDHLAKTLCLISPGRLGEEGAQLMGNALAVYGMQAPDNLALAFGFYVQDGETVVLTTPDPAPYAYVVAIRQFFRRKASD
jgi:hypothetical protein